MRFLPDILMAAGAAASIALCSFAPFAQDCEELQHSVLRLHIPANSNSEYDQSMKLALRDYILEEYGPLLAQSGSLEQAEEQARALLPEIESACCEFLRENGAPYSARAELTEMYFTTREYGSFTMPAGNYDALRITLGSGEGNNWWCVMFPPLCIPAASEVTEDELFSELDEEQRGIEVKFAVYEFFKWLLGEK